MTKFTHPDDAPEGHKWTYEGHPVLEIHEGGESLLVVYCADEEPCAIRTNGKGQTGFGPKVIDATKEHTVWLNVHKGIAGVFTGGTHETRKKADEVAGRGRIACVPLTFKEGEGL